jgi:hypothetical protein
MDIMFAAAVLVCSMQAGLCAAIDDKAGPYATHEECEARIGKMIPVAVMFLQSNGIPGPYKIVEATCTKVQEV